MIAVVVVEGLYIVWETPVNSSYGLVNSGYLSTLVVIVSISVTTIG